MKLLRYLSKQRFFPLIIWDSMSVFISFFIALSFRFDNQIPSQYLYSSLTITPLIILIYCLINIPFNLYTHIWRYANAQEIVSIVGSGVVSTLMLLLVVTHNGGPYLLPISVVLLGGLLTTGFFIASRYRQRLLTGLIARLERTVGSPHRQRVLIIGAGESGQFLARQFQTSEKNHAYELVGFIDDDPRKIGLRVQGIPILDNRFAIPEIVKSRGVQLIVLAIHNISGPVMRDILSICLSTPAKVKLLPNFLGNIDHYNGTLPLTEIRPEDLLGRQPHRVDQAACRELLTGKVILVTGAAGSIGSELCRQVLDWQPAQLLLLDNNETGIHDLTLTLKEPSLLIPLVADITCPGRLEGIFARYRPQIIFHAAAYKHVPLMEQHPAEAIRVNVGGTYSLGQLAARYGTERFVLISTDKAVRPSSIMGATKRVCELIVTRAIPAQPLLVSRLSNRNGPNGQANGGSAPAWREIDPPTRFTAVRFGNVLGSRGSVVPTFTRQIENGGPITVTHPEMTRYFMSISEAVSLVIQAATLTDGNDLFMLDMGQKIQILELARKMIRLRGLRPDTDIPIIYTGIRPGEKLHEELITGDEKQKQTPHPQIFRISNDHQLDGTEILKQTNDLLACEDHEEAMRQRLWELVNMAEKQPVPTTDY